MTEKQAFGRVIDFQMYEDDSRASIRLMDTREDLLMIDIYRYGSSERGEGYVLLRPEQARVIREEIENWEKARVRHDGPG